MNQHHHKLKLIVSKFVQSLLDRCFLNLKIKILTRIYYYILTIFVLINHMDEGK